MQANDPLPRKETPNVSKTNETDLTAMGAKDEPLQEYANEAERQRTMQAPNRSKVWARNQQAREVAMSGPRFEQTIMETQVSSYGDQSSAEAKAHDSHNHMQPSS